MAKAKEVTTKFKVYKHTTPSGKIYVGITKQEPNKRWKHGLGYIENPHFYNAIQKYGWDNIRHEILFDGLTKEEAEREEIRLIDLYQSSKREFGYNVDLGGKIRAEVSEETRKKQSISHIGKVLSEEQKKKISNSLKGRTKVSGMLGHKHKEETKKIISDKAKTIKRDYMLGAKNNRAKSVINVTTGEVFLTIKEACDKYKINHATISNCCRGKTKRSKVGGFEWKYLDDWR